MRVLYLDHPEADFLAGTVYMGLHEILGQDNLVDFQYKRSYHGEMHIYPSTYVDGAMGTTSQFAWMPTLPAREWSRDEVVTDLQGQKFDLVVLASPRRYNVEELRRLHGIIGDKMPPTIFMDGEDYSDLRWDIVDEFKPCVYLKRELLARPTSPRCRVEPFPFASPLPVPATSPTKDIDVLFLGGGTWLGRAQACEALRDTFGQGFVGGIGVVFGYREYLDAIARAKVAISVRGFGYDTLRRWEIPSFPTLMLSDRLPLVTPHPFEDERHCLYFDNTIDLVAKVHAALEDNTRRQEIADAGHQHLRQHHSARARAQQLLNHAGATT